MNGSYPFSALLARQLLADSSLILSSSATVERSGVCGNGVCEVGEVCGLNEGCCIADCQTTSLSCPIASLDRVCNSRGKCLSGSGACDCFLGYEGVACESCSEGFAASYRNGSLLCSFNASLAAVSWNIPQPWAASEFLQYAECIDSRGWMELTALVNNGTAQTGGLGMMMQYPIEDMLACSEQQELISSTIRCASSTMRRSKCSWHGTRTKSLTSLLMTRRASRAVISAINKHERQRTGGRYEKA
ncbi:hypothetical protein GUITHDRAFT_155568 [Guillardia theta CCMP2712]|uniref:EGF-like domain-containing protein n=1 Tax=Guillardia theta (strain CCMP2712) TaxID=905079 RepID=L1IGA3_GUITC|nr:hypothetical protein GUITHDRAFT_155568 [Guillardia theta CCMP2712]EKX35127.1 hypothetical protein GUITHDRAFT_155568 [Guillardia theta CCMP2712]|eukprot:XP_005822107.1 hypothetical protein GUITHDRAFT_155568 [Guillardia theta CCMP2712]